MVCWASSPRASRLPYWTDQFGPSLMGLWKAQTKAHPPIWRESSRCHPYHPAEMEIRAACSFAAARSLLLPSSSHLGSLYLSVWVPSCERRRAADGAVFRRPEGRPGRECLPRVPQEVVKHSIVPSVSSRLIDAMKTLLILLTRLFAIKQLQGGSEFYGASVLRVGDRSNESQRIQHHFHRLLSRHALQWSPTVRDFWRVPQVPEIPLVFLLLHEGGKKWRRRLNPTDYLFLTIYEWKCLDLRVTWGMLARGLWWSRDLPLLQTTVQTRTSTSPSSISLPPRGSFFPLVICLLLATTCLPVIFINRSPVPVKLNCSLHIITDWGNYPLRRLENLSQ